jgi:hypothetical protein
MGTALAVRHEEQGTAVVGRGDRALSGIAPMNFEQIVQMGEALVRTGFLPDHIKNGAQAAAIIMTGQELGMAPMRSIRSLQMVKGKVVESADSQLARFKADGGHSAFRRLDEDGAVLFLRHPNGDEHEESFTAEDAQAAGLLGKEMYGKFRKAMLRSRAITAALKSIGWEGGVGNYDPSEAIAFAPATAVTGSADRSTSAPAQDAEEVEEVMTIETALAMPLPGAKTAWNGKGGTPLGQLDAKMVPAIRKWVNGKIEEGENANSDVNPLHYRLRNACDLIIAMRQGEADKDQTKMELGTAPAAAPAAENPTTLAPGKIEDALKPAAAKSGAGIADLSRRITSLLKAQKLTSSPDDLAAFKKRLETADTLEALQLLVTEIETYLELPF